MTEPGSDEVAVLFSSVFGMGMFNCSVICAAAAVIMLELGAWASGLYLGGVGALALSGSALAASRHLDPAAANRGGRR